MKTGWLGMVLALAISLPGLVGSVSRSDTTAHMEVLSVASSQFTWMRLQEGEADAWLVPSWNERPRIHKPPLVVWANLAAWTGLSRETATPDVLLYRARWVGFVMVILTLCATAWAGNLLGGRALSFLAPLIFGTMFITLKQTSVATYDTHLMAWTTLCMAAALQALMGRGSRGVGWWCLAGVFLGLALLTKGPVALLFTIAPLLLMVWLPSVRLPVGRRLLGLLFLVLVAFLVAAPWYSYIAMTVQDMKANLATEYIARREENQPFWYYLGLLGLVFPWTLALIPSLGKQPRGNGWMAAVWALTVFVLMSIPGAKQQRYIVPILPAMALWIGAFLLASDGKTSRLARGLFAVHAWLLTLAAPMIAGFVLGQPMWISKGWIDAWEIVGLSSWVILGGTLVALMAAVMIHRAGRAARYSSGAVWTALWMSILGGMLQHGYERSHHGHYRYRAVTEQVKAETAGATMAYLKPAEAWWTEHEPDEKFFFYMQRVIPPLDPAALAGLESRPDYLLARDDLE
ncbi:MAG: glycosyltransferase family 39 protein, partial [Kiritimatiellae bacterium]|nr:glycosyltransferase family 39 protein [Kiritimatiellia bacterium]